MDSCFLENGKNVMNFKSKCEEWLNEWEASLDLSEIEKIKDKVSKRVGIIIRDAKKGMKKFDKNDEDSVTDWWKLYPTE